MQTKDNRQLYFDMLEHPEQYTDEQLESMMDELDSEPDTAQAWQEWMESEKWKVKREKCLPDEIASRFTHYASRSTHYASRSTLHSSPFTSHSSLFTLHSSLFHSSRLRKMAAAFVGLVLLSGLAFAVIYLNRQRTMNDGQRIVVDEQQTLSNDSSAAPVLFDNVPLDSVLNVVAAHYQKVVAFRDEAPRSMKLIMTWQPDAPLADFLDRLNAFDGFSLHLANDTIIVINGEEDEP